MRPYRCRMGFGLISALALTACGNDTVSSIVANAAPAEQQSPPSGPLSGKAKPSVGYGRVDAAPITYNTQVLAEGLEQPWSMAFLPNGDMLVTERAGRLRLLRDDKLVAAPVFDFNDLPENPVHVKGQAGLFDIVLHPDFMSNNHVYISYAAKEGSKNTLYLVRYTYDAEEAALTDPLRIFRADPARKTSAHYGARLVFLPDDTFILTSGEGYRHKDEAQSLDNHFGKTIRLNADGSVPADNPFVNTKGALPEIYSYGHRNPQGIILGTDGKVYENEHGPRGGDEINIIEAGKNYGWPAITYGIDYSGAQISPYQTLPNMEQPIVHFVPSFAPSGFAQYTGDKFPDWKGDMFASALVHKNVRHINVEADGSFGAQAEMFNEIGERVRDVREGPDGFVYLLTEKKAGIGGKVIRVTPK